MDAWHSTPTSSSRPPRTTCGCTSPGTRPTARPTCRSSCAARVPTSGTSTASATSTALAGLFVSQLGHGRTDLAEAAAKQAQQLAFMPLWSYAHPNAIELAAAGRGLRPRRPQPGLLHQRWRRGRRVRVEAGQELLQAHRQADEAQGDQPDHRLPRHHPGRARRSPACPGSSSSSSRWCPRRSGCRTRTSTGRPSGPTTSRRSAGGPPTRSPSRSRTRAPTPWPPSSWSRCRTPAAASRRRPATSSGSARSATSTTCCWSPTR